MRYTVEIRASALRGMKRFPKDVLVRIDACINALGDNPRPHGVRKLTGFHDRHRVRVGDYRVIYEIHDDVLVVLVVRVVHRREGY